MSRASPSELDDSKGILWQLDGSDASVFPQPTNPLSEPEGLVAIGGDLQPLRIFNAYYEGVFPWYNEDEPILWWSPDPRCVVDPKQPKISRSLKKSIRNKGYTISVDQAFPEVIKKCAEPTQDRPLTWISDDMINAYEKLHSLGYAHSIECWLSGQLVGGLYGLAIGGVFCGESMFSRAPDASKVSFMMLCHAIHGAGFSLIDGQLPNPYLQQLGAVNITRHTFLSDLQAARDKTPYFDVWKSQYFNINLLIKSLASPE